MATAARHSRAHLAIATAACVDRARVVIGARGVVVGNLLHAPSTCYANVGTQCVAQCSPHQAGRGNSCVLEGALKFSAHSCTAPPARPRTQHQHIYFDSA